MESGKIKVCSVDGEVLDQFLVQNVDSITVYHHFDVGVYEQNREPEVPVHLDHFHGVCKSGRILQIYCLDPVTRKGDMYFYDADMVYIC